MCEYEVQYRQRLEQERAQWNQYRESVERELGELRRRLTEGQEEENLEDEMKKVGNFFFFVVCARTIKRVTLIKFPFKYAKNAFSASFKCSIFCGNKEQ